MFEVTIEHPGIEDRTYFADRQGELRNIVWGVARAQGKPTTNDREMIAIVGGIASDWAIRGEATLKVHDVTVIVRDPAGCDGHAGEDGVLLGGPETCDGSCKPRPRFQSGRSRRPDLCARRRRAGRDRRLRPLRVGGRADVRGLREVQLPHPRDLRPPRRRARLTEPTAPRGHPAARRPLTPH